MEDGQPRKIVKVARRREEKLLDEEGNELEFEGEVLDEPEEEDVVQRDDEDWEDEDDGDDDDSDEDMSKPK